VVVVARGSFPLFLRETGALVGTAILKPLVDGAEKVQPEIEIGWHLRKSAWGQGYATEAARALLARAFELTSEDTIWVVVQPPNERSLAVARRIGMRHVGRTERYYGRELELFAMTRSEHEVSSAP
jgi:ribosomal-protein-alanine N-acetyltransferase